MASDKQVLFLDIYNSNRNLVQVLRADRNQNANQEEDYEVLSAQSKSLSLIKFDLNLR